MNGRLGVSVMVLAMTLAAVDARAQIGGSGAIQGTVLDASGGALPAATVTATHVATGVATTRQTTGGRRLRALAARAGRVPRHRHARRVPVLRPGLGRRRRARRRRPERHAAGRRASRRRSPSPPTPPPLRTADARLGQTIRNDVYTALPLVMNTGGPRDPTAFMFLMPGVQSVGRWGNVMGGQDFTNDTYVEGVPITNAVVQGEGRNLSFGISVEAIDQFQVETSGTAVMYNGQGASNYVVKSGTNQLRGSAFEFFRNKALDTQGVLRRHQARRQPARVRLHRWAVRCAATRRSSSSPTTATATAARPSRAWSRFRPRRSATATSARCRSSSTTRRRRGPTRTAPASSAIRSPATSSPRTASRRSRATCSRTCPIRPTPACRTTISAGSLPIGFNNDNITAKVDLRAQRRGTRSRCSSRTASAARRRRTAAAATRRRSCRCPTPRRASSRRSRPRRR